MGSDYTGEKKSHRGSHHSNGDSGANGKRKVPKVFSKEAITKFRSWLFQNLTVRLVVYSLLFSWASVNFTTALLHPTIQIP